MNSDVVNVGFVNSPHLGSCIENYDFEEALKEVNRLVSGVKDGSGNEPRELLSHHLNTRGFLHLQLGHYDEALADCTEAREMNPDLDQNNLMLAALFSRYWKQVIVPAMEELKVGISTKACTDIAMAYHNTGFFAHAVNYFHLGISVARPEALPELYNALAGSYLGAGFIVEAFVASARSLSMNPDIDSTNFRLASWQLDGIGVDKDVFYPGASALDVHQDVADINGDDNVAYLMNDYPSALKILDRIITDARNGKLPEGDSVNDAQARLAGYLNHRALCHLKTRNFDQAIKDSLEARRLDINVDHETLRLAKFLKVEYGRSIKPMLDELHREISAEGYNKIGVFYFRHKFYANAAVYFQLAASMSEGLVRAESYNNLAGAYLDAGLVIDALRASNKAKQLNPDINQVNFNLAYTRLKPMALDVEALLDEQPGDQLNNYH